MCAKPRELNELEPRVSAPLAPSERPILLVRGKLPLRFAAALRRELADCGRNPLARPMHLRDCAVALSDDHIEPTPAGHYNDVVALAPGITSNGLEGDPVVSAIFNVQDVSLLTFSAFHVLDDGPRDTARGYCASNVGTVDHSVGVRASDLSSGRSICGRRQIGSGEEDNGKHQRSHLYPTRPPSAHAYNIPR